MNIGERIASIIRSQPDQPVMDWKGRWWTRGQLAAFDHMLEGALRIRGIEQDMGIAIAGRNRPTHCFALLSLQANERPISMLYAFQAAESLARDLASTRFAAVLIDEQDWTEPVAAAADASGTVAFVLGPLPDDGFRIVEPETPVGAAAYRLPGPGIEILSSGTTGLPKRLFHPANRLFRSLDGKPPAPDAKPEALMWPLSGIGGNMTLATAMIRGVPFVLFEKFSPEEVAAAVKRHGLTSLSVTPTMVRMLYDADIPREDLASLTYIIGGAGPLDPDLHDRFEERYGVPLIWAMGATEFCGTIVAWNMDLRRDYWGTKRGSSGRTLPGCTVRIVDADATDPATAGSLPVDAVGRMVVKVDAVGPEWIVTNDLARIDADGFIFLTGRADSAIIRGGFKIVPEKLCQVLRAHPDVAEAAVIGIDEPRLGQVPVAVIEPRAGRDPAPGALEAHMRAHLAAPQIPVRFFIVDRLPYTASTKVALGDVRKLVAQLMPAA